MAIVSLLSCSHVKTFMALTRADHLFIHNYIRSLLNIILRHIVIVRTIRVIIEKKVFLDTLHLIAIEILRIYVYFNFFLFIFDNTTYCQSFF